MVFSFMDQVTWPLRESATHYRTEKYAPIIAIVVYEGFGMTIRTFDDLGAINGKPLLIR